MHADPTLDARMLELMLRMGSRWVIWLLCGLSLAALAVALERVWFFVRERAPRPRLHAALDTLRGGRPQAALAALAGLPSMQAAAARACLAGTGPAAAEERLAAAIERERLRFERGLAFLGTLGNNAPFVGLFGTVLGIVRAFHDMSAAGAHGTQAVMAGIAEALVATGIGLLVALPAVALHNAFVRHVEATAAAAAAIGHDILAEIKARDAGTAAPAPTHGQAVAESP